jgi:hypothetical protein
MQSVQKIILYLASAIGVWLLVSFGGAMFDSVNAAFWSSSLMWSLLSFLIVMPALALMSDFSAGDASSSNTTAADEEAPSFVEEDAEQAHTLWPEADSTQESPEWPQNRATDEQDREHARV